MAGPLSQDIILETALSLAQERGWRNLHLHDVAARLDVPLAAIAAEVSDLDAVCNRLFARARDAMLAEGERPEVRALSPRDRIERVLTAWFAALAPHRAAARDILLYKLAPLHLHHQAGLIVALSRTVQWLREAAGLTAAGARRSREEAALTFLFATTLLTWLTDSSPGQERTRQTLHRRLARVAALR
jgi:AcrR family transcriptional regulator